MGRSTEKYFAMKNQRRESDLVQQESHLLQRKDGIGYGTKSLEKLGQEDQEIGISWVEKA